jgi:hypothetical protein
VTGHLAGFLWHLADYGAYAIAVGSYFLFFGVVALTAWRLLRAFSTKGADHADHY